MQALPLYIITRSDLTAGYQIAQTAHGVAAFAVSKPDAFSRWHTESQFIIALQTEDVDDLEALFWRTLSSGLEPVTFREPDLNHELTAIAFTPNEANKQFFAGLPLAGKGTGAINKNSAKR